VHPTFSVILFTVASGAGYGLLALTGLLAPFGALPADRGFGLAALGLAFVAISAGLLSSTFHLGQPRRAWRAFSQWRTSWLSREGVASVATYVPFALFGALWVLDGRISPPLGLLSALGAAITVYCTGMIYRSLKPIPRWSNSWVVPNYLALGLMTGGLWLDLLAQAFGPHLLIAAIAPATVALAAALKIGYWQAIDTAAPRSTAGSATGLGGLGSVRLFEAPHTSENYLLKEMGYRIARKHAAKLRAIAITCGFVAPGLLSLVPFAWSGLPAVIALFVAACLATTGALVERWLFFAEAKHVVTLYYGEAAA
jgi:DMSO reductase anchor subunit